MLKSLNIKNIAIIEKAAIDFSAGLNVLTGETGAGKSIVIDSINAVTGEKTSRELIRTGESSASVSALFENISPGIKAMLEENALPTEEDGSLLLQRRLQRDGKNICRVNGAAVTVSVMKSIGTMLINIHGQRDSQMLLNPAVHLKLLDSFAGCEGLRGEYGVIYSELCDIKKEMEILKNDEEYKERRLDLLTYQVDELEKAEITVGERKELHRKKSILISSEKLINALHTSLGYINGGDSGVGAMGLIDAAAAEIAGVFSLAKGLDALSEAVENARTAAEDAGSVIEDVLDQLSTIDGSLDKIEERLDLLYRLSKKYGETEEEMLAFLQKAREELDGISSSEQRLALLRKEYAGVLKKARGLAEKLSEMRKAAGEKLSKKIESELSFLNMPSARFSVCFSEVQMNGNGIDGIEFYLTANTGEEAKPLYKVASGGELSRVMLALRNVLNTTDGADTLIFDEIDTGVSGSAARRIAVKLAEVSKNNQIVLITHLAQIAAFADEHKYLYKEERGGKTFTKIKTLSDNERPFVLAKMSYGGKCEQVHIDAAGQMIENAAEIKKKL